MTKLIDSNEKVIIQDNFITAWYKLIELIGTPLNTSGELINSIADAKKQLGENGIACFTNQSDNYKTNKNWYTLIKKDMK